MYQTRACLILALKAPNPKRHTQPFFKKPIANSNNSNLMDGNHKLQPAK
jgi:hypothetical protein